MTAGFAGALAVVRVQVAVEQFLVTLPMPVKQAQDYVDQLTSAIGAAGDGPALLSFDNGTELDCWFRAREVLTVDVVSTEDPGAGS